MIKKSLLSLACLASYFGQAQLEVTTKNFDLETINRHKNWNLYSGFADNGNLVVKIGQPRCDQATGGGTVTTYGVAWDFEELVFDANSNYVKTNPRNFSNSAEAVKYEPVWGKTFSAANISLGAGASLANLTGEDLGKTFVIPTAGLTGINKISRAKVETEVKGVLNKKGTAAAGCNQYPVLSVLGSESIKDQKGQKWMHVKSFPQPASCVSLFLVDGDGYPKDRYNYVLRKFGEDLTVAKSLTIELTFNNAVQILEHKNEAGKSDYILVFQTSDNYGPKGITIKEANYAEVMYVDGETFEMKFKESLQLPYSRWFARETLATADGSVLVFGPAGKDTKSYLEMPGAVLTGDAAVFRNIVNTPKESPNLIMLKLKGNKVAGVVVNTVADAQKVTKVVSGGTKKSKGLPIFNYPSTAENANVFSAIRKSNRRIYYKNDKIIVVYQALVEGSTSKAPTLGDMTVAVFDNAGKVESVYLIPENGYSNYDEFFSADGSKLYWITYDYASLNKEIMPTVYEASKVPNTIAAIPQICVLDLKANTAGTLQKLGGTEWGIDAKSPVIADTDQEIVFQAKSISKKAKESELVLVRVKK